MTYSRHPDLDSTDPDLRRSYMDALWGSNKRDEQPDARISVEARAVLTALIRRCGTSRDIRTDLQVLDSRKRVANPNALTAWPTIEDLMTSTGLSKSRVLGAITEAEFEGWVTVYRTHRRNNVYVLGWPTMVFHEGAWLDPYASLVRLIARRLQMRHDAEMRQRGSDRSDRKVPSYVKRVCPYMIDNREEAMDHLMEALKIVDAPLVRWATENYGLGTATEPKTVHPEDAAPAQSLETHADAWVRLPDSTGYGYRTQDAALGAATGLNRVRQPDSNPVIESDNEKTIPEVPPTHASGAAQEEQDQNLSQEHESPKHKITRRPVICCICDREIDLTGEYDDEDLDPRHTACAERLTARGAA